MDGLVKVIQPQLSAHDQFVARFRREAEAAGRLRHPNVVDVTDFGLAQTTDGPVAYLVMEYLDGCSLADIVAEEGALPIQWVIDILEQVCAAVETAHQAGIIHRDSKQFGFNFSMSGGSIFAQLLNVLVTPLTAIMASLLYLKTRRAGGESLRDASDQFEALDIPQSKWQARMKSRWTNIRSTDYTDKSL